MHKDTRFTKLIVPILLVVLLLSGGILAACGKSNNTPTATPTVAPTTTLAPTTAPTATLAPTTTVAPTATATLLPTATPTATATSAPTATPTPNLTPVKIGVITDYSGPGATSGILGNAAVDIVQMQVKDRGGILGGRPLQIVTYDMRGQTAEAAAGAKKLILEDKVSAVCWGGFIPAHGFAVADVTDPAKVFFSHLLSAPELNSNYKWTAYSGMANLNQVKAGAEGLVLKLLKPKTVAYLIREDAASIAMSKVMRSDIEAAGIKTVTFDTLPVGTTDLSPFLTRVKYLNPDVFLELLNQEDEANLLKAADGLGGFGKITHVAASSASGSNAAIKLPQAEGMYVAAAWLSDPTNPGATAFEQAYIKAAAAGGSWVKSFPVPEPNVTYFYNGLWAAIAAIELAGTTDPAKVAEAARSGNLKYLSAQGEATVGTNGENNLSGFYVRIKSGTRVLVNIPQ